MGEGRMEKPGGMSDEAVKKATGRDWDEWIALLDAAGAPTLGHAGIARYLHEEHAVPGWWSQMVTVGYEQARGLRVKHQACSGDFQASGSKTIAVPLDRVFDAWNDAAIRAQWLPEPITIRKATPGKSLRITWDLDGTSLDVQLYAKGEAKCQVSVQHNKLADAEAVAEKKAFWSAALGRLKALLEGEAA